MCAITFTLLRNYMVQNNLLHEGISKQGHIRIRNKNRIALVMYMLAASLSDASIYISFVLFLVVPVMYFMPENINQTES